MSTPRRLASWAAVLICVAWALASLATVAATYARVEYALAAGEARLVAEARAAGVARPPSPRRILIGDGPVTQVRTDLSRYLGREVRGLESQDRATVHARWGRRVVTVPVKDREEWDIIGVVALRAEPWRNVLAPAAGIVAAMLFALMLALRGIRRLDADRATSVYEGMIAPLAALAVVMAALAVLVRMRIDEAAQLLPRPSLQGRFDPLALPLPNGQLAGLLLALILVLAAGVLFAAGWAASAAR
ncbi:MAG: hypothetical protein ABIZ91_18785, partial [Gemmatimonadaceae bacterium]